MTRRKMAFTLAEILIALAIAGIIMTAGIAPLLYASRLISSSREQFSISSREQIAANRIFQDVREASSLNASPSLRIIPSDSLGYGENSILIVWTMTPSYSLRPMGSVAWGTGKKTVLDDNRKDGIYRLVVSGDLQPGSISPEELNFGDAVLALPGVKGVTFEALVGREWKKEYSGAAPGALRVKFRYDSREAGYEDILPGF